MSYRDDPIRLLKSAVTTRDPALAARAVDDLRSAGYTYRDCFRVGLAADGTYTLADFADLMARAGRGEETWGAQKMPSEAVR